MEVIDKSKLSIAQQVAEAAMTFQRQRTGLMRSFTSLDGWSSRWVTSDPVYPAVESHLTVTFHPTAELKRLRLILRIDL